MSRLFQCRGAEERERERERKREREKCERAENRSELQKAKEATLKEAFKSPLTALVARSLGHLLKNKQHYLPA